MTRAYSDKKSNLKLQQEFLNEIIADKKDINDEIVWNYLKYQNPYLLAKDFIFSKPDSEFSYTEVWFTDQNSKPLDIEDKINITLVIN